MIFVEDITNRNESLFYYYFCRGNLKAGCSFYISLVSRGIKLSFLKDQNKVMKKILNNIFHRIKEDSLARRKDAAERHSEYKDLKSVKTGLVIWYASEQQNDWLKKLSECFKEVEFDKLCYMPAKEGIPDPVNTLVLRNDDLGFGGKIAQEQLPGMLERKYDILVDLSTESNVLLNYVLLNSRASCKVGMDREGGERDIVIDGVTEQLTFIDKLAGILSEIKRY